VIRGGRGNQIKFSPGWEIIEKKWGIVFGIPAPKKRRKRFEKTKAFTGGKARTLEVD